MEISYKKLWKLLIDKDWKKKDLEENAQISHYTMNKLVHGDNVTTDTLVADGNPHPVKPLGVFNTSRNERAGRRHVPHHRQGTEFGMQRQGQLPIRHQLADGGTAGRFHDMP